MPKKDDNRVAAAEMKKEKKKRRKKRRTMFRKTEDTEMAYRECGRAGGVASVQVRGLTKIAAAQGTRTDSFLETDGRCWSTKSGRQDPCGPVLRRNKNSIRRGGWDAYCLVPRVNSASASVAAWNLRSSSPTNLSEDPFLPFHHRERTDLRTLGRNYLPGVTTADAPPLLCRFIPVMPSRSISISLYVSLPLYLIFPLPLSLFLPCAAVVHDMQRKEKKNRVKDTRRDIDSEATFLSSLAPASITDDYELDGASRCVRVVSATLEPGFIHAENGQHLPSCGGIGRSD
ncbi:hypothetical protein L249_0844 [Ophiocordyceps polyrhachis-furcata BCC 54312]|uniref:Uncharacterized protein n=1 Tax=Ophiocordyceps polyrhachis-furcata BCC 54312 TaxID=1330021 RepID=A0A367LC45_9HYPO|nr:hypothetical protein L249_0844 [Ophiocordyceps polyrhachis-furcata BCC 54312]